MKVRHCFSTMLQQNYLKNKLMKQAWTKMMVPLEMTENDVTKGTCQSKVCPLISITGVYNLVISQWAHI